jgi:hypothetical protein
VDYLDRPAPNWQSRVGLTVTTENKLDIKTRARLEIDTLHVRHEDGACGARMGVQQVVWGGADRLQVLDVIHPLDLRESYFGDWRTKRLPLAMLNLECDLTEQSLQMLLVPQTRFNRLPSPQGRFARPSVATQLAAQGTSIVQGDRPQEGKPSDWSGGAQWRTTFLEGDMTLNFYRGWQGDYRYRPQGSAHLEEAARFSMAGASYARPVGPLVVRLEGAHTRGLTGYVRGEANRLEPVPTRQNSYLLGVDYSAEPWFLSAQHFDRRQTAEQQLAMQSRQRITTLALRRSLMQDRLHLSAYAAFDHKHSATYGSLAVRYELHPQMLIKTTVEHFGGNSSSFGLFGKQSRWIVGVDYYWK